METPTNNPNPDEVEFSQIPDLARERLDDPTHISESVDVIIRQLASPEVLKSALNRAMVRHAELYNKSLSLRDEGKSLPKTEQEELDHINESFHGLQWINENYLTDTDK